MSENGHTHFKSLTTFAARLLIFRDVATKNSLGGPKWKLVPLQVMTFLSVKKCYFSFLRNKL